MAVLIIVIVAGVAGAMLLNNGSNDEGATPTPTPAPSVADASTLTYSANVTSQAVTTEYKWQGKDIHSNDRTIRVDFVTYAYIMDAGEEKSWISTDSGATWTASDFTADWASWSPQWTEYIDKLAQWSGSGDFTYTNTAGEAIVLFSINVNPTIPDATFTVS